MKKAIKIIAFIILLLIIWIGIDRYKNVNVEYNDNETASLFFGDSTFVKIPEEQWIEINREEFKPASIHLLVENYNPIFHTWKNTLQSLIIYFYLDPETLFPRSLDITESIKSYEMENIHQVLYKDNIDNVDIVYGSKTETDYVLQFKKDEKIVNIDFDVENLNYLMPLFESIFEDLKD